MSGRHLSLVSFAGLIAGVLALGSACASDTVTPSAVDASEAPDAGEPDDAGADDAAAADADEGVPPEVELSADPQSGEVPLVVRFDASATRDSDGDLGALRWDFGDGATAEGAVVEHTFTRPGSFRVVLTAEDARGHTAQRDVIIQASLPACPTFGAPVSRGSITSSVLTEISGLVASRVDADLLWVNNDSGDGPRIYALNARGSIRAGYELAGAQAVDWEDIAIGPGPVEGTQYIYVGDIGDNDAQSDIAPVYRIVEPTNVPAPTASPTLIRVRNVDTVVLSYGGGRAFNAETMMVDPRNGDLYVVTKSTTGRSLVFRANAPIAAGARIQMDEIGAVEVRGEATGGDISTTGEIIIRTYEAAFLWRRPEGMSVADALAESPCLVRLANEQQGEAISFSTDGRDLWTTSEGMAQRLYGYARQ